MICPRCDTVVSDNAERCPQCQKRLKRPKLDLLLVPLVVLLGLGLGFWASWRFLPGKQETAESAVTTAYEDSEMAFLEAENRRLKEELDQLEAELEKARATKATTTRPTETKPAPTEPKYTEEKLAAGETWRIEGQWELTLHDVRVTERRDSQFEADRGREAAQVIVVRYSFTNLGFEDDYNGENLFLWPVRAIDAGGELGEYYGDVGQLYPQEVPIGASFKNGEYAFSLNNPSEEVTVNFSHYDGNGIRREATYVDVPVNFD